MGSLEGGLGYRFIGRLGPNDEYPEDDVDLNRDPKDAPAPANPDESGGGEKRPDPEQGGDGDEY
jgi:hypothetical protein